MRWLLPSFGLLLCMCAPIPTLDALDESADSGIGGGGAGSDGGCNPGNKACEGACQSSESPTYGCGGPTCKACALEHVQSHGCASGSCSIVECEPGYIDNDDTAATGCETNAIDPAGLVLWLRSSAGVERVGQSKVSKWLDQAHQHDATGPAGAMPLYSAEGVEFDGQNQYLELAPGFESFSNGGAIFVVAKATAVQPFARFIELSNGIAADNIAFQRLDQQNALRFEMRREVDAGATIKFLETTSGLPLDQVAIHATGFSGSNGWIRSNCTQLATANDLFVPPDVVRSVNYIGKSVHASDALFQGVIKEIIVYNQGLSPERIEQVERYLRDVHGELCGQN